MAILAVGDEAEFFANFNSSASSVQTAVKDPDQRGGISVNRSNPFYWDLSVGSVSECWVRAKIYSSTDTSTTNAIIALYNSSTAKEALRLLQTQYAVRDNMKFSYNNSGSTYSDISGSTFTLPSDLANGAEIVFYFKRGSSGALKVWIGGILVVNLSGAYSTVDTTWDTVRFAAQGNAATWIGAIVVASSSLLNRKIDHLSPSAAGTYSEWTGSYTDLLDNSSYPNIDTSTLIETNTTGQRFTAAFDNMSTLGGSREIEAVALAARGIIETGSGISLVKFKARLSGTDYLLDDLGLSTSASSKQVVYSTDPASNAWTVTNVNAIEYGVESA